MHGSRDAIVRVRLNEVAKRNKKKNAENAERTNGVQIKKITQRHATECGRCLKLGLDECKSRKRRIVRLKGVTIRNKEINRQYNAQSKRRGRSWMQKESCRWGRVWHRLGCRRLGSFLRTIIFSELHTGVSVCTPVRVFHLFFASFALGINLLFRRLRRREGVNVGSKLDYFP